jgi:hypothetical protein
MGVERSGAIRQTGSRRHTYASLLLQDGESPTYVMGHCSIQVTVDVYGHFIPGRNQGAVERLASATSWPVPRPNFDATMTVAADVQALLYVSENWCPRRGSYGWRSSRSRS